MASSMWDILGSYITNVYVFIEYFKNSIKCVHILSYLEYIIASIKDIWLNKISSMKK